MRHRALACAALLACTGALAEVTVTDAWVRGTVPAQKTTGAFLTLTSSEDARVVGVSTPVAEMAEIHVTENKGGVMQMHGVEGLALPAGKPVKLEPGGHHVMLMGLRAPVAEGARVPLTFTIEDRQGKRTRVEVSASVRPLGR